MVPNLRHPFNSKSALIASKHRSIEYTTPKAEKRRNFSRALKKVYAEADDDFWPLIFTFALSDKDKKKLFNKVQLIQVCVISNLVLMNPTMNQPKIHYFFPSFLGLTLILKLNRESDRIERFNESSNNFVPEFFVVNKVSKNEVSVMN